MNRSFAHQRLFDNEPSGWVHLVRVITDIDMFAEQAAITDRDVRNGCETNEPSDIHIVADDEAG